MVISHKYLGRNSSEPPRARCLVNGHSKALERRLHYTTLTNITKDIFYWRQYDIALTQIFYCRSQRGTFMRCSALGFRDSDNTHWICVFLLAPTGALVVMMVYYTYIYLSTHFFRFSLIPLMQLMLQVSL